MNDILLTDFNFNPSGDSSTLTIPCTTMKYLQDAEYLDNFGFYQELFGVFSFMTLNKQGKYVLSRHKSGSTLWDQYKSCMYKTSGLGVTRGSTEINAIPHYLHETWCNDELLNSCFQHLNTWRNGDMTDEDLAPYFNQIVKQFMHGATKSLRATLAISNLHDFNSVKFADNVDSKTIRKLRNKESDLSGWLKLVVDTAEDGESQMNIQGFVSENDFDKRGVYTGKITDAIAELRSRAKGSLTNLMNNGGMVDVRGRAITSIILASGSYFQAVVNEFQATCDSLMTNCRRVSREQFTAMGITKYVYFVDGMPVIPLEELGGVDEMLVGTTNVLAIVQAGNIVLGTSFSNIPNEYDDIAYKLVRNDNMTYAGNDEFGEPIYRYGQYHFLSHSLLGTAIANSDMFVGSVTFTEPSE